MEARAFPPSLTSIGGASGVCKARRLHRKQAGQASYSRGTRARGGQGGGRASQKPTRGRARVSGRGRNLLGGRRLLTWWGCQGRRLGGTVTESDT